MDFTTTPVGPPILQITEPDQEDTSASKDQTKSTDQNTLGVAEKTIMRSLEFDANDELCIEQMQREIEDGLRCSTPIPEHLRIENQAEEEKDEEEEVPKKTFSQRTKHLQHKISSQATHLRTKFKRTKKPKVESPTSSPRNSPRNSQASPSERKKFKGPEFSKLKNIHMPKIGKPEFKRPEFTKFKRPDFKINLPEFSKVPAKLGLKRNSLKESTISTEESVETETTTTGNEEVVAKEPAAGKKRFEFTSYPKFFERFRRQSKDESTSDAKQEADDESTLPVEVSTIPRVSKSARAKNFIAARFGRKASEASVTDNESGKYQRYNSEGSVERETSVERRMRVALKNSMEDEEEPLGILQTEEQRQLADYDEENRAIHVISKAREDEFNRRKPLVHQESDLVSDDKDFDWAECEQMRERLVAQHSNDLSGADRSTIPDSENFPSNLSNQETQSSGSSSHRRRTGVIEEIDDDEFFLRRKGISQDNIQIGEYISSAIREGLEDPPPNALDYDRYYDENFNISNDPENFGYDVPPRKPKRFTKQFNKSLESEEFNQDVDSFDDGSDYYHRERPPRRGPKRFDAEGDGEVPVATEYYPHYDDDDGSYYENEQMEGIEQPDILVTNLDHEDDDFESHFNEIPLARQATPPTPPKAPKRRKKTRDSVGKETDPLKGRSVSNSYITNGNNNKEVSSFDANTGSSTTYPFSMLLII